MPQSRTLLPLLAVVALMASSACAGHKRSDHYDYSGPVSASPFSFLDTLVDSLFDFRAGRLSSLYDFYRQAGLQEAVARTAVVMTFAGVAVTVAIAVDYMIQMLSTLTKKRALLEERGISEEHVETALRLLERAATLWQ
ncbi:uncharacterized protein LOC122375074 [Amphibalanus amphitrite]|uniref:uncharacterized protein LOC122375074 n=1 Tax=Amphibalanus amphitrite TaxID=1232801 RepID=UPI001C9265FB|nr:uncharacterized protein LOC122375074 [Amphibalanus amphitrite]